MAYIKHHTKHIKPTGIQTLDVCVQTLVCQSLLQAMKHCVIVGFAKHGYQSGPELLLLLVNT
jgi:hypothetical protein